MHCHTYPKVANGNHHSNVDDIENGKCYSFIQVDLKAGREGGREGGNERGRGREGDRFGEAEWREGRKEQR